WIVTIKEGIAALFADRDDVFVAADLLWYADRTNKYDVVAPDVLVVFGRPRGHRRSYREWVEAGVAPQVVFEIDSPSNTAAEMTRKLAIYDRRGVEEYYYYDPESGRLKGWIREAAGLRPIADFRDWASPRLGITFEAPRRKDALIVRGPDGKRFRTFQEVKRAADEERRRRRRAQRQAVAERRLREEADLLAAAERRLRVDADHRAAAERERADAERRLREEADSVARAERERAERLATLLREMGVDPN
ncbi:MAG: hypothetical protein BGO49_13310, partial [Planctomycetales bacterium 71-10]